MRTGFKDTKKLVLRGVFLGSGVCGLQVSRGIGAKVARGQSNAHHQLQNPRLSLEASELNKLVLGSNLDHSSGNVASLCFYLLSLILQFSRRVFDLSNITNSQEMMGESRIYSLV